MTNCPFLSAATVKLQTSGPWQNADCDGAKCRLKGGQGFISKEGVQGLTGCESGQNTKYGLRYLVDIQTGV